MTDEDPGVGGAMDWKNSLEKLMNQPYNNS